VNPTESSLRPEVVDGVNAPAVNFIPVEAEAEVFYAPLLF
jgi:hypothetical protein